MNFRRRARAEVDINLAPLIDMVFLLLIFFMLSTTFVRETQLKVDLPESASGEHIENAADQQLEVVISASGEVSVNDQILSNPSLETIRAALARESNGDTRLPVVITADAKTPHQSVITAMDAAGQQGFTRLRLSTNEMEQPAP